MKRSVPKENTKEIKDGCAKSQKGVCGVHVRGKMHIISRMEWSLPTIIDLKSSNFAYLLGRKNKISAPNLDQYISLLCNSQSNNYASDLTCGQTCKHTFCFVLLYDFHECKLGTITRPMLTSYMLCISYFDNHALYILTFEKPHTLCL